MLFDILDEEGNMRERLERQIVMMTKTRDEEGTTVFYLPFLGDMFPTFGFSFCNLQTLHH
jgi:hypothetical protein